MLSILNTLLLFFIVVAPLSYLVLIVIHLKTYLSRTFILLLLLLSVLFFNKLLFKEQTLAQQDFNNIQMTFFTFYRTSILEHHQPPMWNSLTGGGYDAFANPLAAYFSPFMPIFLLTNVFTAANVFLFLQVFFCAVFAFSYFKILKLKDSSAFLGSVVFTFNAFITMRLSPNVGVEYIYTYKWIPLLLGLTHLYIETKDRKHLLLLGIVVGSLFEGNTNLAISSGLFWLTYSLFNFGFRLKHLLLASIIGFLTYAIKILPFIYLLSTSGGRISEVASSWRIGKIYIQDFLIYFIPYKKFFYTPAFTPGLIGISIFVCGLIYFLIVKRKYLKERKLVKSMLVMLLLGTVATTYNPLSSLFFTLPVFNHVTIIPAFIIFILLPVVIISALFVDQINKGTLNGLLTTGLAVLIYLEVLIGFAPLGAGSYSFNFLKMNYKEEYTKVDYYKYLASLKGTQVFLDNSRMFFIPFYATVHNTNTLNDYKYFYGSTPTTGVTKETALNSNYNYADYYVSTDDLGQGFTKLTELTIPTFNGHNYQNYAVLDKEYEFLNLKRQGWDQKLRIYKLSQPRPRSLSKTDSHPTMFTANIESSADRDVVKTSITYSPFWKSVNSIGVRRGGSGYIELTNVNSRIPVLLNYVNPFIYAGLLLSNAMYLYALWKLLVKR